MVLCYVIIRFAPQRIEKFVKLPLIKLSLAIGVLQQYYWVLLEIMLVGLTTVDVNAVE